MVHSQTRPIRVSHAHTPFKSAQERLHNTGAIYEVWCTNMIEMPEVKHVQVCLQGCIGDVDGLRWVYCCITRHHEASYASLGFFLYMSKMRWKLLGICGRRGGRRHTWIPGGDRWLSITFPLRLGRTCANLLSVHLWFNPSWEIDFQILYIIRFLRLRSALPIWWALEFWKLHLCQRGKAVAWRQFPFTKFSHITASSFDYWTWAWCSHPFQQLIDYKGNITCLHKYFERMKSCSQEFLFSGRTTV